MCTQFREKILNNDVFIAVNKRAHLASATTNTQNAINPKRLSPCSWADSKESSLNTALAQDIYRRCLEKKNYDYKLMESVNENKGGF